MSLLTRVLVILVAVAIGFGLSFWFPCGADEYESPELSMSITDDEALEMCEAEGLTYDYDAQGFTVFELCYKEQ